MRNFQITTSTDTFISYRKQNNYYIDKTKFIEQFLAVNERVSLFTRPRRFGKTMLMSMLADFFAIKKNEAERAESCALFRDLSIAANKELCRQWMHQYPVVFLSLRTVEGVRFEDAFVLLRDLIILTCSQYRNLLDDPAVDETDRKWLGTILEQKADRGVLAGALGTLTRALAAHYKKPAIVLIDEYDVPIAKAEEHGYYQEMIAFMRPFLGAVLKTNDSSLQYGILTGCLRITKESFFTGLNNITCNGISDDLFADAFGFTQEEVDKLLADTGLSSKKRTIRKWYDGYRFGEKQEIYCPWSIMNYVAALRKNGKTPPKAYWLHSSENSPVKNFIREKTPVVGQEIAELLAGGCLAKKILETPTYETVNASLDNLWSLLYLSGYLTRATTKQARRAGVRAGQMALVIPNAEIHTIFVEEITKWFKAITGEGERHALYSAFWQADAQLFVHLLEGILQKNISSHDLPYENFFHGLLTGHFLAAYPETYSNLEAGHGRFDIQVKDPFTKDRRGRDVYRAAIVEIKRSGDATDDLSLLVEEGLGQITEKCYDVRLQSDPKVTTILHWSIAFCQKKCLAKVVVAKQP